MNKFPKRRQDGYGKTYVLDNCTIAIAIVGIAISL